MRLRRAKRSRTALAAAALVAAVLSIGIVSTQAAAADSPAPDPGTVGVTAGWGTLLVAGTNTPFLARGFNSVSLLLPGPYAGTFCADENQDTVAQLQGIEQDMVDNADSQFLAMKTHWRANAVRLQVSQIGLSYEHDNGLSTYTDMVLGVIKQARAMGLVVIVSMQTEHWDCTPNHPRMPDLDTVDAWSQIAPAVGHDRGVMLEVFNEPATRIGCGHPDINISWPEWADGCPSYGAIGMATLGQAVRAMAPDNVLIFDGEQGASEFDDFTPPADIPQNAAYGLHPYRYWDGEASWDVRFGHVQTSGYPLIATEWNESFHCANDPSLAPHLVQDYLPAHDTGLIVQSWDAPWNDLVDPSGDPADANSACAKFTGASLAFGQFWSEAGNGDPAPEGHVSTVTTKGSAVDSVTLALADSGTQDCVTGPQTANSVRLLVRDARTQVVNPLATLRLSTSSPWTCGSYTVATASGLANRPHAARVGDTLIFRVHYRGSAAYTEYDYQVGAASA